MNKKNTGATLGVLVAVSIGATAYASAMTNLDKDTNTKSLLENKVSYVEPNYKAKLKTARANYTYDLKNTKIGESKKEVAVTESEDSNTLYNANVLSLVHESEDDSITKDEEDSDQKNKVDNKEVEETKEIETEDTNETEESEEEALDKSETDKSDEETSGINETDKSDEETSDIIETKSSADELLQTTDNFNSETYNANSSVGLEEEKIEEPVVETYAEKFVSVEFLNVRKTASTNANIVTTVQAGDKVAGTIEGDWLNTDQGYININFLQDSYPQALVDEIKAKKAEAEKKAQEEAQRKAEAEKKAQEEAQRKAEAEKKAQEEAQRKAEAERKAQEEAQRNKAVNYTGWVNTTGLNIRSNASTNGSILGNLTKGDKVSGVLQNGWIKFNFNGREAFVKASFIVDYEVQKPAPAPAPVQVQKTQQQVKQQVNNNVQQAPVVNSGNGQSAANIAQQFAGYPYVFGASNPSVGFDCSGLVHYAYKQIGVNLSRNSAAQFSNGYAVNSNNLVPGDLVFFSYGGGIDHVGIITGYDGTFIHASTPGTGVVYGNIFSNHYQSVYRGARRIF